jgi:hypothetical protein
MSGKLKRLISHYEIEYNTLITAIDACLAEGDYGIAHRLAKGMRRVGRKLQILMNLQDPLHDEKENAIRRIKGLEALAASESGRVLDYYRGWIEAEKQKLATLEAQAVEPANSMPASTLHQALTKLFEARIADFTLVLSEPKRLHLTVKLLRRTVLIMLPEVQRHRAACTLAKRHMRHLQGLGFRLYDRQDKFLLFLPFGEKVEINQVKIVLSRIAFDCFYFEEFQGQSSIKYHEPEP